MGEHSLQCCNVNVAVGHPSGAEFAFVPVSGFLDPDVGHRWVMSDSMDMPANMGCRFLPADALWNLALAINVYLTLFKKYNAKQLKTLEWRYHLMCYGGPLFVAVVYIFIDTPERGRIYGPASVNQSLGLNQYIKHLIRMLAVVLDIHQMGCSPCSLGIRTSMASNPS